MIDIAEEFNKNFLKKWCHENHLPMPKEGQMNKIWSQAWEAFMKTYLIEHYEEIKQQFLDIPLLTKKELERQLKEKKLQESECTEEKQSSWDRVKEMLDKN